MKVCSSLVYTVSYLTFANASCRRCADPRGAGLKTESLTGVATFLSVRMVFMSQDREIRIVEAKKDPGEPGSCWLDCSP